MVELAIFGGFLAVLAVGELATELFEHSEFGEKLTDYFMDEKGWCNYED